MKIYEIVESPPKDKVFYFSYGMLTDPEQMETATKVGPAILKNFEFELLQFANLHPAPGAEVHGALWQISRKFLARLDLVEGYPYMYDRKQVPVYYNGKKIPAYVYFLTPATREQMQGSAPSEGYIDMLEAGYAHFGLPQEQIRTALQIAYDNENTYKIDK